MFISEVFPAPDGPRMAVSWPDLKTPLMLCRIVLIFLPNNTWCTLLQENYRVNDVRIVRKVFSYLDYLDYYIQYYRQLIIKTVVYLDILI